MDAIINFSHDLLAMGKLAISTIGIALTAYGIMTIITKGINYVRNALVRQQSKDQQPE